MKLTVRTVKSGNYEVDGVDMSTKVGVIKQMLCDTHNAGAVAAQKLNAVRLSPLRLKAGNKHRHQVHKACGQVLSTPLHWLWRGRGLEEDQKALQGGVSAPY